MKEPHGGRRREEKIEIGEGKWEKKEENGKKRKGKGRNMVESWNGREERK